ncbi:hypothetical protein EJ07DRAFT_155008 [Lizonia empirigonia]|nr:hypothetical protein EJ07DRAFT_155008 [Lizonia empirigonia]
MDGRPLTPADSCALNARAQMVEMRRGPKSGSRYRSRTGAGTGQMKIDSSSQSDGTANVTLRDSRRFGRSSRPIPTVECIASPRAIERASTRRVHSGTSSSQSGHLVICSEVHRRSVAGLELRSAACCRELLQAGETAARLPERFCRFSLLSGCIVFVKRMVTHKSAPNDGRKAAPMWVSRYPHRRSPIVFSSSSSVIPTVTGVHKPLWCTAPSYMRRSVSSGDLPWSMRDSRPDKGVRNVKDSLGIIE